MEKEPFVRYDAKTMKLSQRFLVVSGVLLIVIVGAIFYGGYRFYETYQTLLASRFTNVQLEVTLGSLQDDYRALEEAFFSEKARNDAFAAQINDISGTVGKLDKLSRTDPELLQKYSKVYFLNENYIPETLSLIPDEFTYNEQEEYLHAKILPYLEKMVADARDDDVDVFVLSGYRSFDTQAILKSNYRVTYGSGANAFSADQGYSEHQLGTTIDFTSISLGGGLGGFDTTDAFSWLKEHAYKYGFILSYPHSNTYYQYEPWHWRYVGRELARDLHRDEKHFYDLDQRELDVYLVNFFD